jgi:two-component system chemotaxis sensor kinase CheA
MSAPKAIESILSDSLILSAEFTQAEVVDSLEWLDVPILLNLIDDADLLAEFCRESRGLLEEVEAAVLMLEQDPHNIAPVEVLFRAFHTFKGGAGFLKLDPIHCLTHDLESVLEVLRTGRCSVDQSLIDLILACVDVLVAFLAQVEAQLNGIGIGLPITVVGRSLHEAMLELIAVTHASEAVPDSAIYRADTAISFSYSALSSRLHDRISVSGARLDEAHGAISRIRETLAATPPDTNALVSSLLVQLDEVDELLHSLLWVPSEQLFQRMQRVVRDTAMKAGKPVRLVALGGETLLDRRWENVLGECLMHLIRNAIDHGIEFPTLRCDQGKPTLGEVTLNAVTRGQHLCIEVQDDGAGIVTAKVLQRAVQRGLVASEEVLSELAIYELLFTPGFSTADSVTALSGRGVGLDVVRSNIQKIGGTIAIHSELGRGTRFTLQVPLVSSEG